jgi:hypothetical protein
MNTSGGIASAIEDIQKRKEGSDSMGEGGIGNLLIGEGGLLFDTSSPKTMAVDAGILALTAFPPAAIAARLIQAGYKGAKLTKALNQVKKIQESVPKTGLGFKGSGRTPTFMQLSAPEEIAALSSMADGGVVHASLGTFASSLTNRIRKILDKDKKKKDDAPEKKDSDVVEAGSGEITKKGLSFKKLLGYGVPARIITALGISSFGGGEELSDPDDLRKLSTSLSVDDDNAGVGDQNFTPKDLSGVKGDTLGKYSLGVLRQMKDESGNPKYNYDSATGKLTDKDGNRPTFLDYVKSFGSGYLEKVSEDPDFAKKMMAGFAAMGRGREGPVPLSPLGISEFTEGYLGADLALQEAKPADQKLLEYLKQNPDQLNAYLKGKAAEAGNISDLLGQTESIDELYRSAIQDALDTIPEYAKLNVRPSDLELFYVTGDKKGQRIGRTDISAIVQEGGKVDFTNIGVRPNAKARARLGIDKE